MRTSKTIALLWVLWASAAQAITLDAKAVARFDTSYAKCEALFPDMRGHRDEAYLSMWRVKIDAKTTAQFAALRRSAAYQKALRSTPQASAKSASASAANTLENQCQALWAETRRRTTGTSPKP